MRWLLIDKIVDCEPGVAAVGVKTFPRSDLMFMDHFPGFPIVPGVLQIEMMAQVGGKCIAMLQPHILPVLGSVKNAKFYQNIHPGDQCVIKTKIVKLAKNYALADGVVEVEDKRVASATILFGMIDRAQLNSNEFDTVSQDWLKRQKLKANSEQ